MDQQNFEAIRPVTANSMRRQSPAVPLRLRWKRSPGELGLKLGDQNELTIRRIKRGKLYSFVRANGTRSGKPAPSSG